MALLCGKRRWVMHTLVWPDYPSKSLFYARFFRKKEALLGWRVSLRIGQKTVLEVYLGTTLHLFAVFVIALNGSKALCYTINGRRIFALFSFYFWFIGFEFCLSKKRRSFNVRSTLEPMYTICKGKFGIFQFNRLFFCFYRCDLF